MKITKRFYVGANKVFDTKEFGEMCGKSWAKSTLEEAINHAKKILEDKPEQEYAFVVQIIRVVRRKQQPLVVEKV